MTLLCKIEFVEMIRYLLNCKLKLHFRKLLMLYATNNLSIVCKLCKLLIIVVFLYTAYLYVLLISDESLKRSFIFYNLTIHVPEL